VVLGRPFAGWLRRSMGTHDQSAFPSEAEQPGVCAVLLYLPDRSFQTLERVFVSSNIAGLCKQPENDEEAPLCSFL